jgi:hypothetical protein
MTHEHAHEPRLGRREFIAATTAAAAALTPLAQAVAAAVAPAAPSGATPPAARLADWTIDDMWGVYPRPHEPIGFGRPRGDEPIAAVACADAHWLV